MCDGNTEDAASNPRAYATQQRAGQGEYVDLLSMKRKQAVEDEYAQQMVRERRMQTLGYALHSFGDSAPANAAEVVARAAAFDRYVTEGAA